MTPWLSRRSFVRLCVCVCPFALMACGDHTVSAGGSAGASASGTPDATTPGTSDSASPSDASGTTDAPGTTGAADDAGPMPGAYCNAFFGPYLVSSTCEANARVQQWMPCNLTDGGIRGSGLFDGTYGERYTTQVDCVCSAGECLTRSVPPMQACSTASDCTAPSPTCLGSTDQVMFGTPTCDEGQCHWAQTVTSCQAACANYSDPIPTCDCDFASGHCMLPLSSTPFNSTVPAATQPASPATAACSSASDCVLPQPTCVAEEGTYGYEDSVVSYVGPACRANACVWELAFSECAPSETCVGGACVAIASDGGSDASAE